MHDLSTIKQMNKLAAVKKTSERAKALNRSGSGRLVEIGQSPEDQRRSNPHPANSHPRD